MTRKTELESSRLKPGETVAQAREYLISQIESITRTITSLTQEKELLERQLTVLEGGVVPPLGSPPDRKSDTYYQERREKIEKLYITKKLGRKQIAQKLGMGVKSVSVEITRIRQAHGLIGGAKTKQSAPSKKSS